ncbi:MAG TPA: hypothetical protein VFT64_07115 [Rickettsiales bacterium]|nr:hypothetical protein [Rickettsiales bacterium]
MPEEDRDHLLDAAKARLAALAAAGAALVIAGMKRDKGEVDEVTGELPKKKKLFSPPRQLNFFIPCDVMPEEPFVSKLTITPTGEPIIINYIYIQMPRRFLDRKFWM